ncbi:membrane protein [Bacteroidia bacterium]|nr:membrane protein [Bacteroidia bacterium]
MNYILDWITGNWIETVGAILTLLFLFLEVARKWTMWIVGIISALFYVYINYNVQLYALSGLSVVNFGVSIYGVYCWKFAKTKKMEELPFTFIDRKLTLQLIGISIILFTIIAFVLLKFTDIPNPLSGRGAFFSFTLDNLITTLSIVGVWMAAKKIVESWCIWMFIDPLNVVLYAYKEMIPSVILYTIYSIFAIIGYLQWRKIAIQQQ